MATFDLLAVSSDDLKTISVPKELKAVSEKRYPNQPIVIGLDACLHNKHVILPVINVKFTDEEGIIQLPKNMMFLWEKAGFVQVHILNAGNYPSVAKLVVSPMRRNDGILTSVDDIRNALSFPTYTAVNVFFNEPNCVFKIVHLETSDRHSIEAGFVYPNYTVVEVYDSHTCEKISTFKPTKPLIHTINDVKMEDTPPINVKIDSLFKKACEQHPVNEPVKDVEMTDAPSVSQSVPQPTLDFSRVKTREYSKLFMNHGEVVYIKPK
jgi:hypothetical protein